MATKRELCEGEEAGWRVFVATIEDVPAALWEVEGYTPGWSVKDMVAHVGNWQAEAVQVFEQMRVGTYEARRLDVDAMNERFVVASRDLPAPAVRAGFFAARTRFVQEFDRVEPLTRDAQEWFVESGAEHYGEHLPRLLEWIGERAGGP